MDSPLVLVTGATGYIASRLIPRLLEKGYRVRALARRPESLAGRFWLPRVEVMAGDVMQPKSLSTSLEGIGAAFYLIHNMTRGRGYTRLEAEGARNFASAVERAGAQHIIYLGGLADPQDKHIAPHLRSRIHTGEVLREGRVPVTEFRAGVIAGAGSISFEMIRFITELFPIVPGPLWLKNRSQPIDVRNVIDYLVAGLENPAGRSRVFEIGGPGVMPYGELMRSYARTRGLRRGLLLLPGIPLWFMALGVGMLTPVPRPIAHALIGGLSADSVIQRDEARRTFPDINLIGFEAATVEALGRLSPVHVERVWEGLERDVSNFRHEGFFISCCRVKIKSPPEAVFRVLTALGGRKGWPYANWLWKLRGRLDGWLGGPGPRDRSDTVQEGSIVDYYRVEAIEPNHLLRLHSELRAPGEGWMEWRIDGGSLTQTAFFAPRGFWGFLYWYLLYPFHTLVFRGLARAIARQSESK